MEVGRGPAGSGQKRVTVRQSDLPLLLARQRPLKQVNHGNDEGLQRVLSTKVVQMRFRTGPISLSKQVVIVALLDVVDSGHKAFKEACELSFGDAYSTCLCRGTCLRPRTARCYASSVNRYSSRAQRRRWRGRLR